MRIRKKIVAVAATAAAAVVSSLLTGTPASAAPASAQQSQSTPCYAHIASFNAKFLANVLIPTNVHSDYIVGPANITYTFTGTSTVATATATDVSLGGHVSLGVFGADVSMHIGTTVTYTYAEAESFAYAVKVPPGRTQRLVEVAQGVKYSFDYWWVNDWCYWFHNAGVASSPVVGGYKLLYQQDLPS